MGPLSAFRLLATTDSEPQDGFPFLHPLAAFYRKEGGAIEGFDGHSAIHGVCCM